MPVILIEGGREKGSFNLHATGLQEAPLVISLISAVTHSWAPQFVISGVLCRPKKKKNQKEKTKQKKKPRQKKIKGKLKLKQQENLLWQMTAQRDNSDVTRVAAVFAWFFFGAGVGLVSSDLHSVIYTQHCCSLSSRSLGYSPPLDVPWHLQDSAKHLQCLP